ncbi:MAG: hypothetical protein J6T46_03330, partial [Victivallales bacterium]|nr:hypothetical protein [Victivallales bacterium]
MALGGDSAFKIGSDFFVSDFYNTNYGELLSVPDARGSIWWTSSGWKIPAGRGLPEKTGIALAIGLVLELLVGQLTWAIPFYVFAAVAGLVFVAPMAWASLRRHSADMNVLM